VTVWVDASSGASGDMLLGALAGAGVPVDALQDAIARVAPEPVSLRVERVIRNGFAATRCHVEVADSSLPQDRLSKARIYAGAGIPEYWIVNLRDGHIEILRAPDASHRSYREKTSVGRGTHLTLGALPDASVFSDDLLLPS